MEGQQKKTPGAVRGNGLYLLKEKMNSLKASRVTRGESSERRSRGCGERKKIWGRLDRLFEGKVAPDK